MVKKLIGLIFALVAFSAMAQDVTNNALPIGGGPNVVGWKEIGPCGPGEAPIWPNSSSPPACGPVTQGVVLSADRTYYVNSSAVTTGTCGAFTCQPGSDSNTGLSNSVPFQTIQKAIAATKANLNFGGPYLVTIQLTCGRSYTATGSPVAYVNGPFVGSQPPITSFPNISEVPVRIVGNSSDATCATLNSTDQNTIEAISSTALGVEGVTVTSTLGSAIDSGNASFVVLHNVILGTTGRAKIFVHHSSTIESYGDVSITGDSGSYVFDGDFFGTMYLTGTITQLSNITATAFAHASRASDVTISSTISTGAFTLTGARFITESSGSLSCNLSPTVCSLTAFPGTTAGVAQSFGSYGNNFYGTTTLGLNGSGIAPMGLFTGTMLLLRSADTTNTALELEAYGTGKNPYIIGYAARGTSASPTASQSGDFLSVFGAGGYGASTFDYTTASSAIAFAAAENFTNTAHGTELQLYTTPNLSTTNTKRFTVSQAGGLFAASATGGDKGTGTINAHTGMWVDNTAVLVNGGPLGSPSSAGTIPAFTLGGTIAGGGNQINNVVIGTSTPLAGGFTTLTASTSLGVGNTSPQAKLHVNSNATLSLTPPTGNLAYITGADATAVNLSVEAHGNLPSIVMRNANGTGASPTQSVTNDYLFILAGQGWTNSSAWTSNAAAFSCQAGQNFTNAAQGTYCSINTTPTGSVGAAEAIRVLSSGGLAVGSFGTDPAVGGLFLNGQAFMPNMASDTATADSTVCTATTGGKLLKGTGTAGICLGTSSARFKTQIVPMTDGLNQIVALSPKNFFYKKGHGDDGARLQYGLIAEDVVSVLPKLVGLDADKKPNSVDLVGMVPVLINAVKALKADNDNMKAQIAALQKKSK